VGKITLSPETGLSLACLQVGQSYHEEPRDVFWGLAALSERHGAAFYVGFDAPSLKFSGRPENLTIAVPTPPASLKTGNLRELLGIPLALDQTKPELTAACRQSPTPRHEIAPKSLAVEIENLPELKIGTLSQRPRMS